MERFVALAIAAGAIVIGVVIYAGSTATFPYWPDSVANPLYDVMFRLIGDNLVAPNLGQRLGLDGIASIAPYLAIVAGVVGLTIVRVAGARALALALVIAAVVIAGYRLFPSNAYADRAYRNVRTAVDGR